ncbi:Colicin I receptor precursor [Marinibacterium anthonyi]|nr:Colicin I receptor precursor [Marinibacterium anthonyi]
MKQTLAAAALTAFTPTLSLAQYAEDADATELGEIVVSGGFTPIEAQRYGRAATVITAEEIEARGITTVQDALRAVPGVQVNGSGDSFTQVRIRGGEANHTLVLIDGIEAAGGDSEYVFSGLDTANIDRIEVLRGPQSVFYGSNASAGVINIITRSGGYGSEYGGTVEVGTDGYRGSARVSTRTDKGGLAFNTAYDDDKGYDLSGSDGEKDGIRRGTVQLTGDYLVTPDLTLGFNFRRSEERYREDSTDYLATTADQYVVDDPVPYSDRHEQIAQVWGQYDSLGGRLTHRLSYERTDFDQSANGGAWTETDTQSAKYIASFGIDGPAVDTASHLLNVFLEWQRDSSSTNPLYERETSSVALEYRGTFDNGLSIQLGARRDVNDVFADATTWTASGSYTTATGIRLHASAGKGIVNPTYFELYSDEDYGTQVYLGNPDLKPEENTGFDLGVELPFLQGRGLVDVTYFNETLTNEIVSYFAGVDPVSGASVFSYENEDGDSPRQGVELAAQLAATDALSLRLSYTYLDAENPDGSVEIRRPRHDILLSATHDIFGGRGSVTGDLHYVAGNYDTQYWGAYATEELANYATVDVSAQYDLTDNLVLTGRITNLLDKEYSDVWGYASRGRAAYIGLRASF